MPTSPRLKARNLHKQFVLHLQNDTCLPVLAGVDLDVGAGDCVVLDGASGSGKSTLLRCLYANYRVDSGRVEVWHEGGWVDLAGSPARTVAAVRRQTIGYVSQFLRAIPRVAALDLVAEPLRLIGENADAAKARAGALLARLQIPERLWHLPPATFSGGEQQRVNIARGLIVEHPILLLDEPTASLDAANRERVIELIAAARSRGSAIVGIFHDQPVREAVCNRRFVMATGREQA